MEKPNSIEVERLVREFKKGPRAVDGIDLHVDPRDADASAAKPQIERPHALSRNNVLRNYN
jgi:hypothetical protein